MTLEPNTRIEFQAPGGMVERGMVHPLRVQIGQRRYSFTSFAAISAAYSAARDASGEGASTVPSAKVFDGSGQQIAHVSYNGKVWPGTTYEPGAKPLFDPYP